MDEDVEPVQEIADRHGVKCAGDTACGFGNTAMVLAEQKMIPRVFAAVVRAISAVSASGVGWVSAVRKPRAPALATAETSLTSRPSSSWASTTAHLPSPPQPKR